MSRPSIRYASLRRGPRYHEPDWWLLTILLTLVMFRWSAAWVYYEGELRKG